MSSTMNTNVFNNLTEAFAAMSTGPKLSQTTNGDANYAEMGQEFKDFLLELDHGIHLRVMQNLLLAQMQKQMLQNLQLARQKMLHL